MLSVGQLFRSHAVTDRRNGRGGRAKARGAVVVVATSRTQRRERHVARNKPEVPRPTTGAMEHVHTKVKISVETILSTQTGFG